MQGKHIKDALIKECLDGGVPEEFDEVPCNVTNTRGLPEHTSLVVNQAIAIANTVLPEGLTLPLRDENLRGHYANLSFHSWTHRNIAVAEAAQYLRNGLNSLEDFLDAAARKGAQLPLLSDVSC